MPSIMLKDGDFGAGAEVTVNETEFFLPDPARPGLREVVLFTAVEDIESIEDDRSAQYREAKRLGLDTIVIDEIRLHLHERLAARRREWDGVGLGPSSRRW